MSEAGYTLTETLAAMAVIGLAIGGFSFGMQVLGALQWGVSGTVAKIQGVQAAQRRIERLLAEGAPYRTHEPERFAGDADDFRFDCGAPAPCEVNLTADAASSRVRVFSGSGEAVAIRLPAAAAARFVYQGSAGPSTAWPPQGPRQALRAVSLLQASASGETAVFESRVWPEQPARCAFDPIAQDCG